MARLSAALGLAAALACAARTPAVGAVSLWELALAQRPALSHEALREAERNAVLYQLQTRALPMPPGMASLAQMHIRQQYERAVALDPNNPGALAALARMEERDGRHDLARTFAERCLAVDPSGPFAPDMHFTLALIHTRQERFDAARDDYLRELTFTLDDDEVAIVYGNLADTYVSLDDMARAIDAYRAAVRANPSPLAWLGLAVTLDRTGADATAQADRAVSAATNGRYARMTALQGSAAAADPWALLREIADPNVFFIPVYDRHYYDAVALEAVARELAATQATEGATDARERALMAWETYLADAPADDRWRRYAERHAAAMRAATRAPARRTAAARTTGPVRIP